MVRVKFKTNGNKFVNKSSFIKYNLLIRNKKLKFTNFVYKQNYRMNYSYDICNNYIMIDTVHISYICSGNFKQKILQQQMHL